MDFDNPTSSSRDEKPPPVKSMNDVPSSSKSSSGRICRVGMLPEDELHELEEVLMNSTRQEGKELKLNMYDRQRHSMRMLSNRLVVEVDMKAIIPNLSCDICHDVIKGSVMTKKCGHRFCDQCIMLCIMRAGSSCPTCRHALGSKRELKPDPRFDNFIAELVEKRSDVARFMAKHNIETEGYPDERYRHYSELEEDSDEEESDEQESEEDEDEEEEEVESGSASENEQESESESVENEEEVEDEELEDEEDGEETAQEGEEEEESEAVSPEESENENDEEEIEENHEAGSSDDADDEEEKEDLAVEEEISEDVKEEEEDNVEIQENEVEPEEEEVPGEEIGEMSEDNDLKASPEADEHQDDQKSSTYEGSSRETTPPEDLIAINLEFLRLHNHPYPETDETTDSSFEESEVSEDSIVSEEDEEEDEEEEDEEEEEEDVEEGEIVEDEAISSGSEQDSDLTQLDSDDREYRISEYEFSGTDDSEWTDEEVILLLNDASGVPSEVSDSSSDDSSDDEEDDDNVDKVEEVEEENVVEKENDDEALENISDDDEEEDGDDEEDSEEQEDEEEEEEEEDDFDSDDCDSVESYPSVVLETIPAEQDQPDHTRYLKRLARTMTKERLEKMLEQECIYEKHRLEELMEAESDGGEVVEEDEEGETGELEEGEIKLDENGFPVVENLDGIPIDDPNRASVDKCLKDDVIDENRSMSRSPSALQICEDEQPVSTSTPLIPSVIESLQNVPKLEPEPSDEPVILPPKETLPDKVSDEPEVNLQREPSEVITQREPSEVNTQREPTPGTTEYEGEDESESDSDDSEDIDDEKEGEEKGENEEVEKEEKDSLDNSEISQSEFGPIENDEETDEDDNLDSEELLYQQTVLMLERRQNTLPTADEVFNLLSKDYEVEKDLEVGQNIDDINLAQILSEPMDELSDNKKFLMGKNYNMIEKLVVEVATRMKMQTVIDSEALEHPEMFMDADSFHQLFDPDYTVVNPNDRVEYNQESQPSTSFEPLLFPQNLESMPEIKQELDADVSMISQEKAGSSFNTDDQPDKLEKMDVSQDVSQIEEKLEDVEAVDTDYSNPEQLEKMTEEPIEAVEEGECDDEEEEEEEESDDENEDFDDEEEESEEEESDDDEIFDENAETTSSSGSESDTSVPDPSKEPLLTAPKFSESLMEKYRVFKKNRTKMLYKEKVKSIKMTTIRMRNVAYRPAKFAQPILPHRGHSGPSSSERPRKMAKMSGNVQMSIVQPPFPLHQLQYYMKTPSKITAIPNVNQQYAQKYGQQRMSLQDQQKQHNQYLAMQQQHHLQNQQRLQAMTPQQRSQEQVAEWLKSPEVIAQNAAKGNDLAAQMLNTMQNNPYINSMNQQQQQPKIQLTPQQQHYQFQLQQLQRQQQQHGMPHMMMNQAPNYPGYPQQQQTPNPYMMQPGYLGMPSQMYPQQTPQPQQQYAPMQNQMLRNQMTPSMWNVQQQQQQLSHEQFMQQHQQRMNQITQAALDRQRMMMTQPLGSYPNPMMPHLQPHQDSSFKKVKTEIQIEGTHSIELELYPTNGYRLKRRSIGGHADTVFCLSAGKSTFAHVARLLAARLPGHQGSQLGSFWAYKREERMLRKITLKQTLDDAVAIIGQSHLVIFYDDISMGDETNHDYIVNSEFLDSKKP